MRLKFLTSLLAAAFLIAVSGAPALAAPRANKTATTQHVKKKHHGQKHKKKHHKKHKGTKHKGTKHKKHRPRKAAATA
jgi:Ni/Co efflux regulator RcnB